ncbi:hypothetical protein KC19_7G025200 [Ceratodon purpureus]|uniref:Uncharacterized protein n=1 Tax=Ceratodon purpureus TaxID=3225 RepID=A0A8T0H3P9_CERPU|nr:hypothetical protein KC19_7G025200 [Ceratodon purpureus]
MHTTTTTSCARLKPISANQTPNSFIPESSHPPHASLSTSEPLFSSSTQRQSPLSTVSQLQKCTPSSHTKNSQQRNNSPNRINTPSPNHTQRSATRIRTSTNA